MNLRASFENIDPLFGCHALITVKVGGPLFEFSEIFNGFQCALRAKEPLNTYSTQGRCFDPVPELLRPNIANQMVCSVCVPVGMTIKTGNAKAGAVSSPVFGGIKLLLRELGNQQAQSFELLRV